MSQEIRFIIEQALGLNANTLSIGQTALRAVIVYVAAVAMVRLGEKRFLGKNTAFDVILGIILGSVVSRAINSSAGFVATLVAGFVLVGLHWLVAIVTFRFDRIGNLFKGTTRTVVKDGEIQWNEMRKSHLSEHDLRAALRFNAHLDDPQEVATARLERSGDISVLKQSHKPRVLEVKVEDGVQLVRIEIA